MSTKGGEDSEVDSASDPDSEEVSSKTRDRPLTYESYTKALADARKHGRKAKVKYVVQTSDSSDDEDSLCGFYSF